MRHVSRTHRAILELRESIWIRIEHFIEIFSLTNRFDLCATRRAPHVVLHTNSRVTSRFAHWTNA